VDNGSQDGTAEFVRGTFPDVRLIRLEANAGFAAANNVGIAASAGEFVATLNNDTVPEPDWLAALVDAAAGDARAGAVSSKMLFAGRPELIDSAGVEADIAGHAWDAGAGMRDPGPGERAVREVFGACAGAALYRRAALEAVTAAQGPERGPFDEDFFAYAEDVDLSWRLRWLGYRCLYAPAARVLHVRSATAPEASPRKTFWQGRNKLWVLFKNYPGAVLARWLPVIMLYDNLAVLRQLAAQREPSALRARLAAWRGYGGMRSKHRRIADAARVTFGEVSAQLAPLAAPWALGRRYAAQRGAYRAGGAGMAPR
jgi:GT2 family glycosyltransferase